MRLVPVTGSMDAQRLRCRAGCPQGRTGASDRQPGPRRGADSPPLTAKRTPHTPRHAVLALVTTLVAGARRRKKRDESREKGVLGPAPRRLAARRRSARRCTCVIRCKMGRGCRPACHLAPNPWPGLHRVPALPVFAAPAAGRTLQLTPAAPPCAPRIPRPPPVQPLHSATRPTRPPPTSSWPPRLPRPQRPRPPRPASRSALPARATPQTRAASPLRRPSPRCACCAHRVRAGRAQRSRA
jgi:hypothetical protein